MAISIERYKLYYYIIYGKTKFTLIVQHGVVAGARGSCACAASDVIVPDAQSAGPRAGNSAERSGTARAAHYTHYTQITVS